MSGTNNASVQIATGDTLDVRSFSAKHGMSQLFRADILAMSSNNDIDFDEVIGRPATFSLRTGFTSVSWEGVCSEIDQVRAEAGQLATYSLVVEPRAWLMTQRRNYRIFQMKSELEIVQALLGEWGVEFETRADASAHKPRKYRSQYDETDFDFMSRMLEDRGISYYFEEKGGKSVLVIDDAPHSRGMSKQPLFFHDSPTEDMEFVTRVGISQRVRPGKTTIGDLDYRKPSDAQPLFSASGGLPQEQNLEHFHYEPGAFLYKTTGGGSTPAADDRGASRTDSEMGQVKTSARLQGKRGNAKRVTFESNALDLIPGSIISVMNHPHRVLAPGSTLLVTNAVISGAYNDAWRAHVDVVPTSTPHAPDVKTPKPWVRGLESATVVGPEGEDIHTDEYGRVRVHFHWDRDGARDETASCWIPSSQPWAGSGFGGVNLPRIGQEVLVEFLGGDPDRPVVVGRVYTETQGSPYKLPKYKNVSGFRSETTPRLVTGAADGSTAAKVDTPLGDGTPLSDSQVHDIVTTDGPFKAASPNIAAHNWKGSEFVHDDTANNEIAYIQAQKDLNVLVKNAWASVVGNYRATQVGTDDLLKVGNKQDVKIGSDQTIHVTGKQETTVDKEVVTKATSFILTQTESFVLVKSPLNIRLAVSDDSFISILPGQIIIQSPRIDLNPAPTPAEVAAQSEADRVAAQDKAFKDAAIKANRDFQKSFVPGQPNAYASEKQAAEAATDPKQKAYHALAADIMGGETADGTLAGNPRGTFRDALMNGSLDGSPNHLSGADADAVLDAYSKGSPP